jgi:hypothetical protein
MASIVAEVREFLERTVESKTDVLKQVPSGQNFKNLLLTEVEAQPSANPTCVFEARFRLCTRFADLKKAGLQ